MLFQLYGFIAWTAGSRHEPHTLPIDLEFEIPDGPNAEANGIEKAREIVKDKHERYSRLTDYALNIGLHTITRKKIWETRFELDRPGTPTRPSQLDTIGHFEEKFLIEPRGVLGLLRRMKI